MWRSVTCEKMNLKCINVWINILSASFRPCKSYHSLILLPLFFSLLWSHLQSVHLIFTPDSAAALIHIFTHSFSLSETLLFLIRLPAAIRTYILVQHITSYVDLHITKQVCPVWWGFIVFFNRFPKAVFFQWHIRGLTGWNCAKSKSKVSVHSASAKSA